VLESEKLMGGGRFMSARVQFGIAVGLAAILAGGFYLLLAGSYVGAVLVALAISAVLGLWLARQRSTWLAMAGRGLVSFAAAVVLFVIVAGLVYTVFYRFQPYDRYADEGGGAFKVLFWIAVAAHLALVPTIAGIIARRLRSPALPSVLGAAVASALLALPTIATLAYFNNCYGIEYPLGRMSCG
jgi:ABC-type dipeptide/oligopeptide/nickel transport system permease component